MKPDPGAPQNEHQKLHPLWLYGHQKMHPLGLWGHHKLHPLGLYGHHKLHPLGLWGHQKLHLIWILHINKCLIFLEKFFSFLKKRIELRQDSGGLDMIHSWNSVLSWL